jgi:hypothetical protein
MEMVEPQALALEEEVERAYHPGLENPQPINGGGTSKTTYFFVCIPEK